MIQTNSDRLGPTDRGYVTVLTDANGLSTVTVAMAPGARPFAIHNRCKLQTNGITLRQAGPDHRTDQPVAVFRARDLTVHLVPLQPGERIPDRDPI